MDYPGGRFMYLYSLGLNAAERLESKRPRSHIDCRCTRHRTPPPPLKQNKETQKPPVEISEFLRLRRGGQRGSTAKKPGATPDISRVINHALTGGRPRTDSRTPMAGMARHEEIVASSQTTEGRAFPD